MISSQERAQPDLEHAGTVGFHLLQIKLKRGLLLFEELCVEYLAVTRPLFFLRITHTLI
jgi:hypothetical protein